MEWLENTREFQERNMGKRRDPMEIALQRIQGCTNRKLDLSKLKLTELPPLPDDLIMLRCDLNELTSLPELPSTLRILHCHMNQLTSLPDLPPFLESISCSNNPITSLPTLPSSLTQLVCNRNYLTSLPPLPDALQELCFDHNHIAQLDKIPSHLTSLSCCWNQLTSLPSFPNRLESLFCFANPLETMPEFPSTLVYLVCTLPHTNERYAPLRMTPDMIQQVNRDTQAWTNYLIQESKERSLKRCKEYKEEIMMKAWHPSRVEKLLEMGYDIEDM